MQIDGNIMRMVRGDTASFTVRLYNESGDTLPFADGDTVYFTVMKSVHDTEKLIDMQMTEFVGGAAPFRLEPADTVGLTHGIYAYDIRVKFANGAEKTITEVSTLEIAKSTR